MILQKQNIHTMQESLFRLNDIRMEISFSSIEELISILSFYQKKNINKLNIPCKNKLKKDFLKQSIMISRNEFPNIDIIPHFSIQHQFRRNKTNTLNDLIEFSYSIKLFGCREILLISGSNKKSSLDTVSALKHLESEPLFFHRNSFIGIAFNPYLPDDQFELEISRFRQKINTGFISSIWFQFGTDYELLNIRINRLMNIINKSLRTNFNSTHPLLYGSILIPTRKFIARFKFRPWKGVYCSSEFLDSLDYANIVVKNLLLIYKRFNIIPIVETSTSTNQELTNLNKFFKL